MDSSRLVGDSTRSFSFRPVLILSSLFLLFALTPRAYAQTCSPADQIAPNPNPAGSVSRTSSLNSCNGVTFDNFGTLQVITNSTLTNSGTLNNNSGALYYSESATTLNNIGTLNNRVDAELSIAGGTLNNYGLVNNGGYINGSEIVRVNNFGELNNFAGARLSADRGLHNESGGALNNAGTLSLSGFVNEAGGTVNNSGLSLDDTSQRNEGVIGNTGDWHAIGFQNNGTFNNEHGGTLTVGPGFSASDFTNTRVVNNAGTWSVATFITNTGAINNTGSFSFGVLDNSGTVNNSGAISQAGAINNSGVIGNSGSLSLGAGSFSSNPSNNSGTWNNSGTLSSGREVTNSGQFTIAATGAMNGDGTFTQSAGKTIVDGSMTQAAVNINGGVLQGIGSIVAPVVVNGGTVSAGNSIGSLLIGGNLTFNNSGLLLTEIGGIGPGQFDLLHVTGTTSFLNGVLGFSFGDFDFHAGDHWTFLTSDGGINLQGFSTQFAFADPGTARDFQFDVALNSSGTELSLMVAPIPEPQSYTMVIAGLIVLSFATRRRLAGLREGPVSCHSS